MKVETYASGASRSDSTDKLDYANGLSVQVLTRYLEYLQKHQTLPDGSKREFWNWKRGMSEDRYVEALLRHTVDLLRCYRGLLVPNAELEDLCCAVIFNSSGLLFERLVTQSGNRELPLIIGDTCMLEDETARIKSCKSGEIIIANWSHK